MSILIDKMSGKNNSSSSGRYSSSNSSIKSITSSPTKTAGIDSKTGKTNDNSTDGKNTKVVSHDWDIFIGDTDVPQNSTSNWN